MRAGRRTVRQQDGQFIATSADDGQTNNDTQILAIYNGNRGDNIQPQIIEVQRPLATSQRRAQNTFKLSDFFGLFTFNFSTFSERVGLTIVWVVLNILYLLTIIGLFLCLCMLFKVLASWQGLGRIVDGFNRRRARAERNEPPVVGDDIWADAFPAALNIPEIPNMIISFVDPVVDERIIYQWTLGLAHNNPFIWIYAISVLISFNYFLSFLIYSVSKSKASLKVTSSH